MSKLSKVKERLAQFPRDFTWDELVMVLSHLGYETKNGDGSRRSFIHNVTGHRICLHEPHPKNIVKQYALRLVVEALTEQGLM